MDVGVGVRRSGDADVLCIGDGGFGVVIELDGGQEKVAT